MNPRKLAAEFIGTLMLVASILFVALFSYGNAAAVATRRPQPLRQPKARYGPALQPPP